MASSARSRSSCAPPRATPTFFHFRSATFFRGRSLRETSRAPPLAKPATTKTCPPPALGGRGLALPLGLLMGARPLVYAFFNPVLQLLRPIPPIAYIPLAILWFGLGNPPAFFLISLGAFFPVLMNTIAGVRAVDTIHIRAARNLGAGEGTLFWRVMVPAAMPYILTGIRVGIGVAFIVVIVAEMIAVNSGLGYRILEAREYF